MPGQRLFSAIVPPRPAVARLASLVDAARERYPDLRWEPEQRWHVTLGFFGDSDDSRRRERWLHSRAAGLAAPRLRLAGSGSFRGVLWVGVRPASESDARAFVRLARACGAGRRGFRAHLTLARWKGRRVPDGVVEIFAEGEGPWFTPRAVSLVRSDLSVSEAENPGPRYTEVARVPLAGGRTTT